MKYLLLICCFFIVSVQKSSAQATQDTVVWGNIQNNFPGGQEGYNKYIADSVHYPKVALDNRITGCTYLRFIIEKDGTLTDVKVYRGVGSGMDEEAWRLLHGSSVKWIPSKINGAPVRTRCRAAVNFMLKENDANQLSPEISGKPLNPKYLKGTVY
jgi:outer membrane biosynthesis protein TonB